MKSAKSVWNLTLSITTDDLQGPPSTTVISQEGNWQDGSHMRPVNECVAITMSAVMDMLLKSGQLVRQSDKKGSEEAFAGD